MHSHIRFFIAAICCIAASTVSAHAQNVTTKPALTLAGAKQVIAAALAEAQRLNATGVIAVVDDGGNLMALERLDGTFAAGAEISIGKARTAAMFRKPTKFFEDIIKNGRTAMTTLPSDLFTPLQGGIPLMIDGEVVGGVGVSGASSAQQDEEFAIVGASALTSGAAMKMNAAPSHDVVHLPASDVTAAFARGMPLVENSALKVHASRREKPGMAEVHASDTDVIYVLEGSATLVTGGAVVDGATTAEGELRGASIRNGEERTLRPGDVVIVPNGVPHWFKDVDPPLLYYVVKVSSAEATSQHASVHAH